jgi:hypothetical protein
VREQAEIVRCDARLLSSESGNHADTRRTVLRAVYARRWFRDALQGLQRPTSRLALGDDFLAGVAPDDLGLFAHLSAP